MTSPTRKAFAILEGFPEGTWHTNVSHFYRLARSRLAKLEGLALDVNAEWPKALDQPVKDDEITPELDALVLVRDTTSDMCRIFYGNGDRGFPQLLWRCAARRRGVQLAL
jgi:hypothetical protein